MNTVYVSPNGNDSSNGSYYTPFKTLQRAFAYASGKGGAQIVLFGGTYKIDTALTLSAIHSGSKQSPLYITAMPGEEVVFTAADYIEGGNFAPVTDAAAIARLDTFTTGNHQNVYVADLAALGITSYGEVTTAGEPLFIASRTVDGETTNEQYTLARYPNANDPLLPLLTKDCVLKQPQVWNSTSTLYKEYNKNLNTEPGWKLDITASVYREHVEKWAMPNSSNEGESIWLYGALYEEWNRAHYPVVITKNDQETVNGTGTTMSSTANSEWGILDTESGVKQNNGYFYNIMEELDADGEWYLDHDTGKLYVYASDGMENCRVTMVADEHTLLTVDGASNVVLNGITFAETLGRGLLITKSENVLVQNCTFRDMRDNACRIEYSYNSGIIFSDFSRTSTAMMHIQGTDDRSTMTPDRIFLQNCYFHDPKVQQAVRVYGISCLVSHNLFEHTTVTFIGAESILEYNRFNGGSQITYDSGPIYCSGPAEPKGNHIRYNYLYNLNTSRYGIYLDDLSSDNYVYSNVIIYAAQNSGGGRCVNLHGGHQNVVCNNICVNASVGIRDDVNYYLKEVYDTSGNSINTPSKYYQTSSQGNQLVQTENVTSSGGLSERWSSWMKDALSMWERTGGSDSRYAERFPNLAIYMELTARHLEQAASYQNYTWETATVAWDFDFTQKESTYPWGNMSLRDFLFSFKDTQDIEVYLRSPAYNAYYNNVLLGCGIDILSYTQWGLQTTMVRDNYGLHSSSTYFTQAMNGDLSAITQAETWQSVISDFETVPYEKFGYTEKNAIEIFCPIENAEEDYDLNQSFDELAGLN